MLKGPPETVGGRRYVRRTSQSSDGGIDVLVSPRSTEESDRELLLLGRAATVAMNRANAARWSALVTFFRRRLAAEKARKQDNPHAPLTSRQETVVEVGDLWGMSTGHLRRELNVAIFLADSMPSVWDLTSAGALDHHRARMIADTIRRDVDDDVSLDALDRRLSKFLLKHLRSIDGQSDGLVCCTPRQLQNKLAYEVRRLRSADAEARFARKFADRRVSAHAGDDGMGWLTIENSVDRVQVAHRRLTLAAKELRAAGDDRTLDQLRSDLALDALTGAADVPVPSFARPIVNVTVPIQTLMGIADHPGELSGGAVIPAGLARVIAQRPGATWFRMLTDERGHVQELSTKSYQPTAPIWRQVIAENSTCFRPGCDRPATECELDHRIPWPTGLTSVSNLWPACKADHKAKHTPGFTIEMTDAGQFSLKTPTGFAHPVEAAMRPVSSAWPELPSTDDFQFSVAEFVDAVEHLRAERSPAPDLIGLWEDGPRAFWHFADIEVVDAVYQRAA